MQHLRHTLGRFCRLSMKRLISKAFLIKIRENMQIIRIIIKFNFHCQVTIVQHDNSMLSRIEFPPPSLIGWNCSKFVCMVLFVLFDWFIGKSKIRWTCFAETMNSKYDFIFSVQYSYRLENCYSLVSFWWCWGGWRCWRERRPRIQNFQSYSVPILTKRERRIDLKN